MNTQTKNIDENYHKFSGSLKIWRQPIHGGKPELVLEKPNMVLYQGSDILANSLGGKTNSHVSHMYIGFHNGDTFTAPTISKTDNRDTFQSYTSTFGYLRFPLSMDASYFTDVNYSQNNVVFTTTVVSAASEHGATFSAGSSYIYEAALVNAQDPLDKTKDRIFSRANFSPIEFVSSYNLIISWAVKFVS